MSEKRRSVCRIIDRLFPELAGMEDKIKPISNPETPHDEKLMAVVRLLKQETPNLDALMQRCAQRRKVGRGRVLGTGVGDWKIYENDSILLLQCIKLRGYLELRLKLMDSFRFTQLFASFDERQTPLDKAEYDRIDATRFFSFPPAIMTASDWGYWLRLATLTEEEAVALSLGRNPDIICMASLKAERANDKRPSPFFDQYQLRLRALQRAVTSGLLSGPLNSQTFRSWAEESRFDLPSRFTAVQPEPPKAAELVEEMNPKARRTLRLLVLFMAVNKYGHKLSGNSAATTNIVDGLARYGIPINNKTVRDLLTDAAADDSLVEEVKQLRNGRDK